MHANRAMLGCGRWRVCWVFPGVGITRGGAGARVDGSRPLPEGGDSGGRGESWDLRGAADPGGVGGGGIRTSRKGWLG